MKVLFISEHIRAAHQGASHLARAHYKTLSRICGRENVDVISFTKGEEVDHVEYICLHGFCSTVQKIRNILCGNSYFISNNDIDFIEKLVRERNYGLIFLDNSTYGCVAQRLRKKLSHVPLVTFYHGVCINTHIQKIKANKKALLHFHIIISDAINEMKTVKYVDKNLVLNQREAEMLKKYYYKKTEDFLPVYLEDEINGMNLSTGKSVPGRLKLLFVGGNFWPNILGLKWFICNVIPKVMDGVELYVVGRGLENRASEIGVINTEKVHVIGGVEDLSEWYGEADVVVGPIFHGDGMKTKTAEALMYGKIYLGTQEAICGYIGLDKYCCETAGDFISKINSLCVSGVNKYNPKQRELFEKYYSMDAANKIFERVFQKLNLVR